MIAKLWLIKCLFSFSDISCRRQ